MSFNTVLDTKEIQELSTKAVTVAAFLAAQFNHVVHYDNGTQLCLDLSDEEKPVLLSLFRDTGSDLIEIWSARFDESGKAVTAVYVQGETIDIESALEYIHDHYQYAQSKIAA